MKSLSVVRVPENRVGEYFSEFFNHSTLTFEGLDITNKKSNKKLEKVLRDNGFPHDEMIFYHYTGKDMNEYYHLTGSNAYHDDLILVSIPNFYNPVVKMMINARWFDDIVQNNMYRQAEINAIRRDNYDI